MNKSNNDTIRLLLVDDEEGFRKAIARRLERRGFVQIQASSGEECLEILDREAVDVVVLDVKMPGISGIETLKAIKQRHELLQVILLTGNAAVSDGIQGIKAGAYDYLTKPVEMDHLVNKVRQAVEMTCLEAQKTAQLAYRKKLEKKIVDSERLVALGTMSTGIAHEINNPLAIINEAAGFMKQVLCSTTMDAAPRQEALLMGVEKIEKSVRRASRITHQLLGHVKRQKPQFIKVDLAQLMDETLDLLNKEIQDKQIRINRQYPSGKLFVWSDAYQIRQVLMNLLNNAIHAAGKKGSIGLSGSETRDAVVVEIKDNGPGIPKENIGKIFEPFFTTKSFEEGTGLGLFVVHKIVSDLAGQIEVNSTLGKGTVFTLKFPRMAGTNNLGMDKDEKI
jgi:C4-dicarboxylate-specific signal transduction histidine kinase